MTDACTARLWGDGDEDICERTPTVGATGLCERCARACADQLQAGVDLARKRTEIAERNLEAFIAKMTAPNEGE